MTEKVIDTRDSGYPAFFDEVPPIGTKIMWWGGAVAELYRTSAYTKRDGSTRPLLHWKIEGGRTGTTGLRGKGMYWDDRPQKGAVGS